MLEENFRQDAGTASHIEDRLIGVDVKTVEFGMNSLSEGFCIENRIPAGSHAFKIRLLGFVHSVGGISAAMPRGGAMILTRVGTPTAMRSSPGHPAKNDNPARKPAGRSIINPHAYVSP